MTLRDTNITQDHLHGACHKLQLLPVFSILSTTMFTISPIFNGELPERLFVHRAITSDELLEMMKVYHLSFSSEALYIYRQRCGGQISHCVSTT